MSFVMIASHTNALFASPPNQDIEATLLYSALRLPSGASCCQGLGTRLALQLSCAHPEPWISRDDRSSRNCL